MPEQGLTAAVYSGDLARAGRVASRISAGQVGISNNPFCGPLGGVAPHPPTLAHLKVQWCPPPPQVGINNNPFCGAPGWPKWPS